MLIRKEENMKNIILNHKKTFIAILFIAAAIISFQIFREDTENITNWSPDNKDNTTNTGTTYNEQIMPNMMMQDPAALNQTTTKNDISNSTIGLSVGGAKDINNFRKNINYGYLPNIDDITYEGLFYDYYFETGKQESKCDELFCPVYTYAVSKDPLINKNEYYLSVGLNSNIKKSDFRRKKLNLMVVLDHSGSMGGRFDKYYYNKFSEKSSNYKLNQDDNIKTKLEIAKETIVEILKHLNEDDRFGFTIFDDTARVIIPLTNVDKQEVPVLREKILSVETGGGTYLESGIKTASYQFDYADAGKKGYENRMIILSDEMPNIGLTGEDELLELIKGAAKEKIYTSFIGIGIDFNASLTEAISKVKGANYYSVHSSGEFKKRLNDEFDYMVTPLVFDLELSLKSEGYKIVQIYGSPEANLSSGEIMKVNTLFPSEKKDEQTKGGVIIIKMKKISDDPNITLKVSYKDRNGKLSSNSKNISMTGNNNEYYDNTGIRKAILLTRYADVMKLWLGNEKNRKISNINEAGGYKEKNFINSDGKKIQLNKWERQSNTLTIAGEYKELFGSFKKYFDAEITAIGDKTLNVESKLLDKLINTD